MANTKITDLSELAAMPAADDLLVLVDVSDTTMAASGTDKKIRPLWLPLDYGLCQGRLTTETGVPVSTADRTAQGTIYFTPYNGNLVWLYDGSRWVPFRFTERSLSLTLTSGKNYDVFLYNNAGTLTLELSAAWTNDTTRADALTTQDGIPVKSGATTRRHLGTIRASGTNTTEDSEAKRFVWNRYNQKGRSLRKSAAGAQHDYTSTSTWRYWNNDATNIYAFVVGSTDETVRIDVSAWIFTSAVNIFGRVAAQLNWVSGAPTTYIAKANATGKYGASEQVQPTLGYNYVSIIQLGGTTATFTTTLGGGMVMQ